MYVKFSLTQAGIHTKEEFKLLLPKATTMDLLIKQNPSFLLCTFIILVFYASIVFPKRLFTSIATIMSCVIHMRLIPPMFDTMYYLAACTGLDTAIGVVLQGKTYPI